MQSGLTMKKMLICAAMLFAALLAILPGCALAEDITVLVKPGVKASVAGTMPGEMRVFPTIQNALDHAPEPVGAGRVIIRITPGVYQERLYVSRNRPRITLLGLGAGPMDVVITAAKAAKEQGGTFFTETVEVNGDGFEADNVTFENSAGNVGQAAAIAVLSDKAVFKHCRFIGWTDTLFANYGRQYYVDSYITGATDFIFGNAAAVFERDEVHSAGPGYFTAQSRVTETQTTGYVFLNSKMTTTPGAIPPDSKMKGIALGRPWRPYSRVVYLHCQMDAGVLAAGWNNWGFAKNEATAYYGEFDSSGPGAAGERVAWSHKLTAAEAKKFMPKSFLRGKDGWDAVAEAAKLP
jgi:pectinesterase